MRLDLLLRFAVCLCALSCDLRSDEEKLRDATQLSPLPGTPPEESAGRNTDPAPPAAGSSLQTTSGKKPVGPRKPRAQRLPFSVESMASNGTAVAFSKVSFGTKGSVWLLQGSADPVALTETDAYSPEIVRVTPTAVEFLDNPPSDSSKVYPPEPDTHPVRLMSVPLNGGPVVELVSLRTASIVGRRGKWVYSPTIAGPSSIRDRGPLVAHGPGDALETVGGALRQKVSDLVVTEDSLFWASWFDDDEVALWRSELSPDGRPAPVAAPLFRAERGPETLTVFDGELYAIDTGDPNAYFSNARLSRWDRKQLSFATLVEGLDMSARHGLVATRDAVCFCGGYGDTGVYCYTPETDSLVELSRTTELGVMAPIAPFGDGVIWSERPKGRDGGIYVATP